MVSDDNLSTMLDMLHASETPTERDRRDLRRMIWLTIIVLGPRVLFAVAAIAISLWVLG